MFYAFALLLYNSYSFRTCTCCHLCIAHVHGSTVRQLPLRFDVVSLVLRFKSIVRRLCSHVVLRSVVTGFISLNTFILIYILSYSHLNLPIITSTKIKIEIKKANIITMREDKYSVSRDKQLRTEKKHHE